jgi:UDPglucose--hexose-1-phosphate uridylyltransferase
MSDAPLRREARRLPDGRRLWLYRDPAHESAAEQPGAASVAFELSGHHERRWHSLLREWVTYATARQDRTFLPPPDACPLCPPAPGDEPTEVPADGWEIAVFENRFPSYASPAPPVAQPPQPWRAAPADGACEVVVYTPRHEARLADASEAHVRRLIEVWVDRTVDLEARDEVQAVYVFENRGVAIGVTLHHPHGQIYAYPFVPPVMQRELDAFAMGPGCPLCQASAAELRDGRRLVTQEAGWIAYVPYAARWPYEVHLVPRRHVATLAELDPGERDELARTLRKLLRAYDALWDRPLPYVMAVHVRPVAASDQPFHMHLEFYPPNRSEDRLKYLAGSEAGAGAFINDTLPEETAAELRAAAARSSSNPRPHVP